MGFAIVEFRNTSEVALVSSKWLLNQRRSCYWPKYKSQSKLQAAVKQHLQPTSDDFDVYDVKVMYETGKSKYNV